MHCDLTCAQLPIIVTYFEVCSITICYGDNPLHGMSIPAHILGTLFQCLNELIELSSFDFELGGKRLGAFLPQFDTRGR